MEKQQQPEQRPAAAAAERANRSFKGRRRWSSDVAIGAYASDAVVVLRGRCIVDPDVTLAAMPHVIPWMKTDRSGCPPWYADGTHAACVELTLTFSYHNQLAPRQIREYTGPNACFRS